MESAAYSLEDGTIIIKRKFTELDAFVKKFISVLKRHSEYLIVSGFVSIATGRARGTEDVDILVPVMERAGFGKFFKDAEKTGFWCYQGDSAEDIYPYVREMDSIRFAEKGKMFPNIEFIPVNESKKAKWFELKNPQKMKVGDFEFNVPPIEFEILYKETVLVGKKDMADAMHLRAFFSDILSKEKFKQYEPIVRSELE